jgi:septum site-determining protein MinC
MTIEALPLPRIAIRGRSFMALVLAPEAPLAPWLARLDHHIAAAPGFLDDRPVIANLAATLRGGAPVSVEALDALEERRLHLVGIEGIDRDALAGTRWERLPLLGRGHDLRRELRADRAATDRSAPARESHAPSLLVEGPVRSGRSILFEEGDVTVVGSVASGAEIIAGGSVHVYGALRGRAIAGMRNGRDARIFCRRLEAELVAVDHLYRTAEHWGEGLHGAAVQILRDRGSLRLTPLA